MKVPKTYADTFSDKAMHEQKKLMVRLFGEIV